MKVSKTFYQDMEDLPASHPLYGSEQSKSGFGICYQFAIKCPVSASKTQCFQGFAGFVSYSHSIVAGGLLVTSYTTLLTPRTSFTMRVEALSSSSYGSRAQSAVIKSVVVTARSAIV